MKKYLLYILLCCMFTYMQGFSNTRYAAISGDTLLNTPAPRFTMLDTRGKAVSLTDYKGRILVVCFWSTWCYYCHKDFPMINKVMQRYANDTTVAFLFVDTREKSEQYRDLVQKDLARFKYNFHVVFDEKGKDGNQNMYYNEFGTIGLPTRFIIDGNMNIRQKFIGYDPRLTEEEAAAVFVRSIEAVRK
ncbi:TlpA family protein disulfide reductase [Chitinophaga agri]|uniref:TlpA family protein disulfide reductase n=1 Tax=Chitinophaga agri TaxID=2703787 RepID=A0A6B9Z972_9BACT|nr:TlpA disulfide reductase family protein [Chitinophaga agri]QHS58822.1 TlpA family protein disulfide reductase [Chitinophaga agri]